MRSNTITGLMAGFVGAAMLCLCSCGHLGRSAEGYGLVIRNLSDQPISEADVQFGNFDFRHGLRTPGGGVVAANSVSEYYPVPFPIPAVAKVVWRTSDGKYHEKEVEVKKHVPANFRGYIVFQIRQDTVMVSLEE